MVSQCWHGTMILIGALEKSPLDSHFSGPVFWIIRFLNLPCNEALSYLSNSKSVVASQNFLSSFQNCDVETHHEPSWIYLEKHSKVLGQVWDSLLRLRIFKIVIPMVKFSPHSIYTWCPKCPILASKTVVNEVPGYDSFLSTLGARGKAYLHHLYVQEYSTNYVSFLMTIKVDATCFILQL